MKREGNICLKSLITWFQNLCKGLRPSSLTCNIYSKCLIFLPSRWHRLSNNLNYQEHVSLKESTFAQMVTYWPPEKPRLLKHTAAFINSPFHWKIHLSLLEKANNNQACWYSIPPSNPYQKPIFTCFAYTTLRNKISLREEVNQPRTVNLNCVTSSTPCLCDDINEFNNWLFEEKLIQSFISANRR